MFKMDSPEKRVMRRKKQNISHNFMLSDDYIEIFRMKGLVTRELSNTLKVSDIFIASSASKYWIVKIMRILIILYTVFVKRHTQFIQNFSMATQNKGAKM